MRLAVVLLPSLVLVAACSDDATPVIDAPVAIDAANPDADSPDAIAVDAMPSGVVEVSCAGINPASVVTAPGFSFSITQARITVDDVVRFTMPASHSAVSGSPAGVSDGKFEVGFNATKCFRFTIAGAYPFWCNPHQFEGSITVVPPA